MKKRYLTAGLLLLPCLIALSQQSVLRAAPAGINPKLLTRTWPARWITHAKGPYKDYGVFHFRRTFTIDRVPDTFLIHISADNRYRLFVNGTSVSTGPARSDLDHWRYETVNLAPHLREGSNVLAAVVWNFGIHAPMAQHTYRTGLIVQGNSEGEQVVNTGAGGWKSLHDKAYQPIPITRDIIPAFYVVGPGERVDGGNPRSRSGTVSRWSCSSGT